VFVSSTCVAANSGMPEFSWDTVPRYMHVRKATAFTDDEIKYLATFPLITFEKTTGAREFGSTEKGTLEAAQAVKRVNPDTKILYYRNIIVHYGSYDVDEKLKDIAHPFLADQKTGNTKLVRGKVQSYDLSNENVQQWWMDHVNEMCSSSVIDGLFVDGNIKALEHSYLRGQVGEEKKTAVEEAYHRMMKQLQTMLGPQKIVIANIIRARFDEAGLEYLDYFNGSYIEGFEHAVKRMSRKDYVAKGIDAIQKAAQDGKIIAFTIGMSGYADTDMDTEKGEPEAVKDFGSVQERFTYTLSMFLICAEKYSYFMASDGYGVDGGRSGLWMKDIPEYRYPLGEPKGKANRNGYVYTRSFEHADVTLDVANETADIVWKEKNVN
jgi:hypothetical protein